MRYPVLVEVEGLAGAAILRSLAIAGTQAAWRVRDDVVAGSGCPAAEDLLFPARDPADAALAGRIEQLAPHVVRPVRMVDVASGGGLFGRLFGGRRKGERIDLAQHAAGKPMKVRHGDGTLERAILVDVPRLTVALAIDAVARGAVIERSAKAAGDAVIGPMDADREPAFAAVIRRPFPQDFGYRLRCGDGVGMVAVPLDLDLMLLQRPLGGSAPEQAGWEMLESFGRRFGSRPGAADVKAAEARDPDSRGATVRDLFDCGRLMAGQGHFDLDTPLNDQQMAGGFGIFANQIAANYSHLDAAWVRAVVGRHGGAAPEVLGASHRESDLGEDFGAGLRAREARWMIDREWANTPDDIIRRRGRFAWHGVDLKRLSRWMDRGAPLV
ncbi:MAG: hypothetical protein VYB54_00900 [Pseudomonadota bacterium]|nr:hypothetical protein [Pseudomonadota bacterium]